MTNKTAYERAMKEVFDMIEGDENIVPHNAESIVDTFVKAMYRQGFLLVGETESYASGFHAGREYSAHECALSKGMDGTCLRCSIAKREIVEKFDFNKSMQQTVAGIIDEYEAAKRIPDVCPRCGAQDVEHVCERGKL
jgi:hypothetical protein